MTIDQHPRSGSEPRRLVGVGAGPANLSLAALLDTSPGRHDDLFLETKPDFRWHAGMMLPGSEMQVHYLKDLVTAADPTNPHSFLAWTVGRGEFYRLLNTRRKRVSRREFEAYCGWVARRVPSVQFGVEVLDVAWRDRFEVATSAGIITARNIAIGSGVRALVPPCASQIDSVRVRHSSAFLSSDLPSGAHTVLVVGGGQSGAEIVWHLQTQSPQVKRVIWASRRSAYLPLDESPFVEDFFTPEASDAFYASTSGERRRLLAEQRMASDGVSDNLLEAIYNRAYDVDNAFGDGPALIPLPATQLVSVRVDGDAVHVELRDRRDRLRPLVADAVVLATGYEQALPDALRGLADRFESDDGGPAVREDFSVRWDGPPEARIYLQNGARHARGVADPNLSLVAWRAAKIALAVDPALRERIFAPELRGPAADHIAEEPITDLDPHPLVADPVGGFR